MAELDEPLSERELDVLNCVARGSSNREIAQELTISHNTVKVHLRNIYHKLGVSSRTEAATIALQQGLVKIPGLETAPAEPTPIPDPPAVPSPEPSLDAGSEAEEKESEAEEIEPAALPPASRRWRAVAVGATFLALLAVALLVVSQLPAFNNEPAPLESEQPAFEAIRIGETNWFLHRSMPQPRSGMAMAAVGLNLYEIGGETEEGVVDTVLVYNTGDRVWEEGAPKLTAVADAPATVLFGEIYVSGGRGPDGEATSIVEVYSPANDAWRRAANLPRPIAGALTLTNGSFLYLFGGWDGSDYLSDAFVYDPGSDGWRPLPPMQQPRAFAAGGVIGGLLYVVGGFDGEQELATCEYFNPATTLWHNCADMLLPRGGAAATVLFNRLYVFGGGMSGEGVAYSESYDPSAATWQVVNTPMLDGASSWTDLGVATVERLIYAVGGRLGEELQAETYVYDPFPYQSFIPAASTGD